MHLRPCGSICIVGLAASSKQVTDLLGYRWKTLLGLPARTLRCLLFLKRSACHSAGLSAVLLDCELVCMDTLTLGAHLESILECTFTAEALVVFCNVCLCTGSHAIFRHVRPDTSLLAMFAFTALMLCNVDAWSVVRLYNHVCQLACAGVRHHCIIQESNVFDHLCSDSS